MLWQRNAYDAGHLKSQLQYWENKLEGAPSLLALPTDKPRGSNRKYKGKRKYFTLSETIHNKIGNFCSNKRITPYMFYLSCWASILSRLSGQDDIKIGSPSANRHRKEIESLIGLFVNTLIFRVDLSQNPNLNDLVDQVKHTTLEGYANQDVPFEQVVERLNPSRNLDNNPLFQAELVLENTPIGKLDLPDVNIVSKKMPYKASQEDVTLVIRGSNETSKENYLQYDSHLFSEESVERWVSYFVKFVENSLSDPEAGVLDINILSDDEKDFLLESCNDTNAVFSSNLCIHELFEKQVERSPDAVALIQENHSITYDELNKKANGIAQYLYSNLTLIKEPLVGISMDPSIDMVASILAVLKIGAAYIPLDPNHPTERLTSIISESQLRVVITEKSYKDRFDICEALSISEIYSKGYEYRKKNIKYTDLSSTGLAYVLYTSGSTGKPKGVQVEHRSVINYIEYCQKVYLNGMVQSFLSLPLAFDASLTSIFPVLTMGLACNIQATDNILFNLIEEFRHLNKPSLFKLTPAHLSSLAELMEYSNFPHMAKLEHIFVVGGEALSQSVASKFMKYFPSSRLINEYGPTEATIGCTTYSWRESESYFVPIGSPIQNTKNYLLDSRLNLVPMGVIGELYIAGDCLTRGYLGRPDLTNERYLDNPFTAHEHRKIYKSGDLAQRLSNGDIEYIGRNDDQLKIRGFRIEVGEIEGVLKNIDGVVEAAIRVVSSQSNDTYLLAYFSLSNDSISKEDIKSTLRSVLPSYMLPAGYVQIDSFPMNNNGKIDKNLLPVLDFNVEQSQRRAPTTKTEDIVCQIWKKYLSVKDIGIDDDFFEVGGHSILAIKILTDINKVFSLKLSVRAIFERSTIYELSKCLDGSDARIVQDSISARISSNSSDTELEEFEL